MEARGESLSSRGTRNILICEFNGAFFEVILQHEPPMVLLAVVQGTDFHRDTERMAEELMPALDFRMDAAALEARHFGEVACRDFRESVLAVLPHRCALCTQGCAPLQEIDTRIQAKGAMMLEPSSACSICIAD